MTIKRSTSPTRRTQAASKNKVGVLLAKQDDRSNCLTDIANENDSDAAECAAADLFREFPPTP